MKTKQNPLSDLPIRYRTKNKKWFIDTQNGTLIHKSNIHKYIPKDKQTEELKKENWINKYYGN